MSRIKTEVTYEDLLPYLEYLTLDSYNNEYNLCDTYISRNTLYEYFNGCGACIFNKNKGCILNTNTNPSLHLVVKQIQQLHPELFI